MRDTADLAQAPDKELRCAFYSVSDSRHFVGVVALVNSLRLLGHDEQIFVIDAGLTLEQRQLIRRQVTLIPAPEGVPVIMLKQVGPMTHPARVSVLLDADIIVTRPLTELVELAGSGRLVGFVNNEPNHDRFFQQWSSLLSLGPLRRQPYLNAGQLFIPASLRGRLFEAWVDRSANVDAEQTHDPKLYGGQQSTRSRIWHEKGHLSDPLYFGDQDVLNAVLSARFECDEISMLEHRLGPMPPFRGLRLVDRERLVCRYADNSQPFLLHHIMTKPWLNVTRTTIYSLLLSRVLLAPDVSVRLQPRELPLRLREGVLAAADRRRADLQAMISSASRRQLTRFGIRTRIDEWRRSDSPRARLTR
jgi:hypothetical protein